MCTVQLTNRFYFTQTLRPWSCAIHFQFFISCQNRSTFYMVKTLLVWKSIAHDLALIAHKYTQSLFVSSQLRTFSEWWCPCLAFCHKLPVSSDKTFNCWYFFFKLREIAWINFQAISRLFNKTMENVDWRKTFNIFSIIAPNIRTLKNGWFRIKRFFFTFANKNVIFWNFAC